MKKKSRKPSGELGGVTISKDAGTTQVHRHHVALPQSKEELELLFASQFVAKFNQTKPLDGEHEISNLKQNAENDLDFTIDYAGVRYLELAELNPRSEAFGRRGHETGMTNIYEFARWTYEDVIQSKAKKYGADVAGSTFLLLYTTHWQFGPVNKSYIESLQAFCQSSGCTFAAVYTCDSDGDKLYAFDQIHPTTHSDLPEPKSFARAHMVFSDLGQAQVGENGEVFFPMGRLQPKQEQAQRVTAMKSEKSDRGSNIGHEHVTLQYVKTSDFRVHHVDGVYGGILQNGQIHMALFSERASLPERRVHEINPDGRLGPIVEKVDSPLVFELSADVHMTLDTAKRIQDWLSNKIRELEESKPATG